MGARTAISVEQYLHTSFPDLDREFVDGELVERSSPDYPQGKAQAMLAAFFILLRKRWRDIRFELPELNVTIEASDIFDWN